MAVLGWSAAASAMLDAGGGDELEDLILTSRNSYHLVRRLDSGGGVTLLLHLRLDRHRANLALARRALATAWVPTAPVGRELPAAEPTPPENVLFSAVTPTFGGTATPGPARRGPVRSVPAQRALPAPVPPPRAAPEPLRPEPTRTARPPAGERASEPAERRPPPSSRQVAALPLQPRVPKPVPPPLPRPVRQPEPGLPRWADDVPTMRRLLTALRNLR